MGWDVDRLEVHVEDEPGVPASALEKPLLALAARNLLRCSRRETDAARVLPADLAGAEKDQGVLRLGGRNQGSRRQNILMASRKVV